VEALPELRQAARLVWAILRAVHRVLPASQEVEAMSHGASVPGDRGDAVNHPAHYNMGAIEPIDVIEDWKLGFHAGNVVKYLSRAAHKGHELEDLKKAEFYLRRLIALKEKER